MLPEPSLRDFVKGLSLDSNCVYSSELKMQILATATIAPGFPTLLSNLLVSRVFNTKKSKGELHDIVCIVLQALMVLL